MKVRGYFQKANKLLVPTKWFNSYADMRSESKYVSLFQIEELDENTGNIIPVSNTSEAIN